MCGPVFMVGQLMAGQVSAKEKQFYRGDSMNL
jgi:hypothetical protein